MSLTQGEVEKTVKQYILSEFLEGEDPENLQADTSLINGGIIDSIATLNLVTHLEETFFGVEFDADEVDADHFDTIAQISALILSKG